MSIPRKGSILLNHNGDQFRYYAKGSGNHTVVKVILEEIPDGQVLVGILPKVFVASMVEELIDHGIKEGWAPMDYLEPMVFERKRGQFIPVEEE